MCRPAGIARGYDGPAFRSDTRGYPRGMRALARAVDAFERDEAALRRVHGWMQARSDAGQRRPSWNLATARL